MLLLLRVTAVRIRQMLLRLFAHRRHIELRAHPAANCRSCWTCNNNTDVKREQQHWGYGLKGVAKVLQQAQSSTFTQLEKQIGSHKIMLIMLIAVRKSTMGLLVCFAATTSHSSCNHLLFKIPLRWVFNCADRSWLKGRCKDVAILIC